MRKRPELKGIPLSQGHGRRGNGNNGAIGKDILFGDQKVPRIMRRPIRERRKHTVKTILLALGLSAGSIFALHTSLQGIDRTIFEKIHDAVATIIGSDE